MLDSVQFYEIIRINNGIGRAAAEEGRGISAFRTIALLALLALVASTAGVEGARAQQNIGSTVEAHNQVSRELAGAAGPLTAGDQVFRNELVRTGADSTAKLVFLDSTNLAIGPTSRVTLDRFVYAGEASAQKVTINLVKGVFRFTTGGLDKKAYEIDTPTASIGVRGTKVDIDAAARRTAVTNVEGIVIVCARGGGACVTLEPGQTVRTTKTGNGSIQVGFSSTPVNVGALASGSLSQTVSYASLGSPGGGGGGGGFPAGALCGH